MFTVMLLSLVLVSALFGENASAATTESNLSLVHEMKEVQKKLSALSQHQEETKLENKEIKLEISAIKLENYEIKLENSQLKEKVNQHDLLLENLVNSELDNFPLY